MAGHTSGPDQLFIEMAVNETVQVAEKLKRGFRVLVHRGDEFQLGLRKIGGYVAVGQGRTETWRVRFLGQLAGAVHPQPFFFNPVQSFLEKEMGTACLQQFQLSVKCGFQSTLK